MTSRAHRADRTTRAGVGRWRLLSATLALGGTACLVMWGALSSPAVVADAADPATPASVATAERVETTAPPPRPVRLSIPEIGVATSLGGLGLRDDGTVEVPRNPQRAGWYERGTSPGEPGSAVILGHVDSLDGPAVFARLDELTRGDTLEVTLDDGSVARFAVRTIRTYANDDFPNELVYAASHGRQLNLVTCGGGYDASRGGYQANVVVNARLVA